MGKVHCRICKGDINTEKEENWIMPSKNYYYHTTCYNSWKKNDKKSDEDWKEMIYDFIARDLKKNYNYHMCEKQIENLLKAQRTYKGIYFTLKYFYEIKHHKWEDEVTHGGIGIVPYVYAEATQYWQEQERLTKGVVAAISQQVMERAKTQPLVRQKKVKGKKTINLEEIEG